MNKKLSKSQLAFCKLNNLDFVYHNRGNVCKHSLKTGGQWRSPCVWIIKSFGLLKLLENVLYIIVACLLFSVGV